MIKLFDNEDLVLCLNSIYKYL